MPSALGALAATIASPATADELQSIIVAFLALVVREVVYWWRNRNRRTP